MIEYIRTYLDSLKDQIPSHSTEPLQQQFIDLINDPNQTLTPAYQPIVNLRTQRIHAYEGLIRGPADSDLVRPDVLFQVANELNFSRQTDIIARILLALQYDKYQLSPYLFLNISANVIEDHTNLKQFSNCLSALNFSTSNVVMEITEQAPITDMKAFMSGINSYRDQGFMFALDDLGTGYNGLKLWSEIQPEFIKIDKHFIEGLSQDTHKQHFVETIQSLAISTNTQVITEGIETIEDLEVILSYGIPFGQGYLFAKPEFKPERLLGFDWDQVSGSKKNSEGKVAHLLRKVPTLNPEVIVESVVDIFHKDDSIAYMPVVTDGEVQGMVWRSKIMDILASRFGRDLYARKPLEKIMDKNPIIVEKDVAVENLSRTITDSKLIQMTEAFIITEKQRYIGCGNLFELLRYITDLKIQNALYSNPLSGLPGNVPIQQTMQEWLGEKIEFCFYYIDLDNFKAFNDYYSFEQGDVVLKAVATLLQSQIDNHTQFLGHIGGDDFVILSKQMDRIDQVTESIFERFNELIVNYYRDEDVERGGINGKDRRGNRVVYPIMSLSIGIIEVEAGVITHHQQLSSVATRAKKLAKQSNGNTFCKLTSKEAIDLNRRVYNEESIETGLAIK